jgi:hypothetical protein
MGVRLYKHLPLKIKKLDNNNNNLLLLLLLLLTANGLIPGGSGYFTCIQNMTLITTN